ncbi:MAG TPA: hypothetical protein VGM64_13970 [Lacunisphaera sp.]
MPTRRSRIRQRRQVLAFLALALSTVIATQAAFAIQPPPTPNDFSAPAIHNLLWQVHIPIVEPGLRLLPVSIEPHFPRKVSRAARAVWITCGWGVTNPINFESRVTKLPADPVLVLANGYLKCQSIRSALFDPQVSVAGYPAGHFGDDEYAGLLVPAWIEFFDEASLRKIFHTLAGVADGPDSSAFAYYEMEDPQMKLAEYRRASGFSPELLVEFVGGTDLRIEVNFTQGRMLIQVDDRWDFYNLDQHQAGCLREIIAAGENKPPAI